ncbi:MAG: inositol phosphorylceramide synthase [Bacteroidetes bacterium]|nr:inositol phosphorylceramide synthase [Bacteroidota bacterium]
MRRAGVSAHGKTGTSRSEGAIDTAADFPRRASLINILLSIAYLYFIHCTTGLKIEHIGLIGVYNLGFVAHRTTRKLVSALAVFLIFGILYDIMKVHPNYLVSTVDFEDIYNLEKLLFGIHTQSGVLTVNEYFQYHHSTTLDLTAGIFYLNWMSVPLLFAVYLYFSDKKLYLRYALAFLFVNILGFCLYYIYPAAPPWYIAQYGFVFDDTVLGSAADLLRFDELVGIGIFETIYTRNSNVFAAVPSLHSAYPVVVLYYGAKKRIPLLTGFLAVYMLGIWFAAVYSGHHYIIDVILGVLCAIVGIVVFHGILLRRPGIRALLARYERFISSRGEAL